MLSPIFRGSVAWHPERRLRRWLDLITIGPKTVVTYRALEELSESTWDFEICTSTERNFTAFKKVNFWFIVFVNIKNLVCSKGTLFQTVFESWMKLLRRKNSSGLKFFRIWFSPLELAPQLSECSKMFKLTVDKLLATILKNVPFGISEIEKYKVHFGYN